MSGYERGLELVDALTTAGIVATIDPRSVTPPCVLGVPPGRTYDLSCGYTARWQWFVLAPGPGNADAFKVLDGLADDIAAVLPVETMDFVAYTLSPDQPAMPAYEIRFSEGVS